MIFLVVVPLLVGFATYMVPLMIGARDMAFPRLNALSFWVQIFGGLMLYFSFATSGINGGAPAGRMVCLRTAQRDRVLLRSRCELLDTRAARDRRGHAHRRNQPDGDDHLHARSRNEYSASAAVRLDDADNRFLIVVVMPILNAGLVMLLADRLLNAHFFRADTGGSAVLWQHVFWAFGHPEVYIMVLPAFGIISEVIPVFSGKPIYGYDFVAASTLAIAFLSLTVWAHHMFAVGLGHPFDLFFAICSMAIAVPTGIKIFNWTATMYRGRVRFTTAMLFAVSLPPDVHDRRPFGHCLRGGPDRLAVDR